MNGRRVLLTATLFGILLGAGPGSWTSAVAAADEATIGQPIQVEINPSVPAGPKGVGIVTAVGNETGVQLLVPGAAEGTTATINAGTCELVGAQPVGLIGELSATGQAQATLPLPIGSVADGGHVIVLHEGLDLASSIACGLIPASETGIVVPPLPSASPAPGGECDGVPAWVAAAKARLERLKELEDAANKAAVDLATYLNTIASNIGQGQAMLAEMQSEAVPTTATAAQQLFIGALQSGLDAANLLLEAFSQADNQLYQQALTAANDANQALLKVRTAVGELDARCPG